MRIGRLPLPKKLQLKNDELRKDCLQEYNSSTPRIEHEIIFIIEAGLVAERTERKEGVRGAHTRTEGRHTFPPQW